jgi:hypothetical protein
LSLRLVLEAGSSLRGAAAALAVFARHQPAVVPVPAFSTIRSWLLRVGQAALTRPLDKAVPWLWLVDHTHQVGRQKLLVILGCPLAGVPFGRRALQLSDLHLVALVPMETSTGAAVERELETAAYRTGAPRLIVSDRGSDLRKGIADYLAVRPGTAHVPDVAHYGANLLEHAWADQPRWQQFVRQLQDTSSDLRQTAAAYLLAPRMRPKARFMNVAAQLRFAGRVLNHLAGTTPRPKAVDSYAWLTGYRDDLAVWQQEHRLVQTAIEVVRVQGLHAGTPGLLDAAWGPVDARDSTARIADRLRGYVTTYQPAAAGERFVASTEVLESGFGKLKRVERQQSQDGLTGLVLALGAMVGPASEADLRAALDGTPQKAVDGWVGRALGRSMQWLRRQFFREAKA